MLLRSLIGCFLCLCVSTFKSQIPVVQQPVNINTEIAFASDTQSPLWLEQLFLKTNNNRNATKLIFNNIIKRHPIALFLLGDVVSLGTSTRAWREIDKCLGGCREIGIKVYATLGNHEVMGTKTMSRKGQKKFLLHFPEHSHTGFVEIIDSVAVILLNSNFSTLTKEEDEQQLDWYKGTLKKLETDAAVEYIITGCHHSPYSNSKLAGSNKAVQQKFVKPFMRSAKSRLFLSGHSHAFEHFKREGKDFLVIGGGGGLHQPLVNGSGDMEDLSPGYKPMFHYLTARREPGRLLITSYKLKDDFTGFTTGLIMNINQPQTE